MSTLEDRPLPTRPDPVVEGRHGDRCVRWQSWRGVLLSAVVAVHLAGVLSSPVGATVDDFYGDLAAGRVQSIDAGIYPQDPSVGFVVRPNDGGGPFTSAAGVRWVGRYGFVYQADLASMPAGLSDGAVPAGEVDVEGSAAAMARLTGQAVPRAHSSLDPAGAPLLPLATLGVMLLVVWLLRWGPQPRRFTKWGWFWLIAVLPAGTGAVWYLLREAPWSSRAAAWPALGPRQTRGAYDPTGPARRGGWLALLLALVLGMLSTGLLRGGLDDLAGHHSDRPTSWVVVDHHGAVVHGTSG